MKMYSVEYMAIVNGKAVAGPILIEWEIRQECGCWIAIGGGHKKSVRERKELYYSMSDTPKEAWMEAYKACFDITERRENIEAMYDWCMKQGGKA